MNTPTIVATLTLLAPPDVDLADLLPSAEADARDAAFRAIRDEADPAFEAPLLDLLALAETPDEWYRALDALGAVLGREVRDVERPWRTLTEARLASTRPDPPAGYADFKAELLAERVDPGFRRFLGSGRRTSIALDEVSWGGVAVDGIPALVDPDAVPADEAVHLRDEDPVFGIALGGEARAYPTAILDWHELANDVVGDVPVALTWCTLCGAPIAYRGAIDGERALFGSSGLLWRSNKLMYDRGSDTLWDQFEGRAVVGPGAGRSLQLEGLPVRATTWGRWRRDHPNTTAVSTRTGHDREYEVGAAYGHWFVSADTMFPVPNAGATFEPKERIVIVRRGRHSAAVSVDRVEAQRVLRLDVGGAPAIVVDRSPPRRASLPEAWRDAIERAGGLVEAPSPDDVRAATRAIDEPLPRLDAESLRSLPRATRRAILAGSIDGAGLESPADAGRLATLDVIADVQAYEGGEPSLAPTEAVDALVDDRGRTWRVTADAIVGPEGERRPRLRSHLAFGFAWDARRVW
ncbi:MAG: DUF3179 domain-containing (seleno)protein [Planctomycetota bacterium]